MHTQHVQNGWYSYPVNRHVTTSRSTTGVLSGTASEQDAQQLSSVHFPTGERYQFYVDATVITR